VVGQLFLFPEAFVHVCGFSLEGLRNRMEVPLGDAGPRTGEVSGKRSTLGEHSKSAGKVDSRPARRRGGVRELSKMLAELGPGAMGCGVGTLEPTNQIRIVKIEAEESDRKELDAVRISRSIRGRGRAGSEEGGYVELGCIVAKTGVAADGRMETAESGALHWSEKGPHKVED